MSAFVVLRDVVPSCVGRLGLLVGAALMPAAASAAERTIGVGSFDQLRVEGPFDVQVATGSPAARIVGDRQAADQVDIRLEGTTLTVRRGGNGWGERPRQPGAAPKILLSTPSLGTVSAVGGRGWRSID